MCDNRGNKKVLGKIYGKQMLIKIAARGCVIEIEFLMILQQ